MTCRGSVFDSACANLMHLLNTKKTIDLYIAMKRTHRDKINTKVRKAVLFVRTEKAASGFSIARRRWRRIKALSDTEY